jgi:hypothetical protein
MEACQRPSWQLKKSNNDWFRLWTSDFISERIHDHLADGGHVIAIEQRPTLVFSR